MGKYEVEAASVFVVILHSYAQGSGSPANPGESELCTNH